MKPLFLQLFILSVLAMTGLPLSAAPPPLTAAPVTEAPELAQLRQQYLQRAMSSGRTLTDQFTSALQTLERDLAANGDYDQALIAQKRRLSLQESYRNAFTDSGLTNSIVLKPGKCKTVGSVTYDRMDDLLTGWKSVGSLATWDVLQVSPGLYDVSVTYAAGLGTEAPPRPAAGAPPPDPSSGGEFDFYEDTSLSGATQNHRMGSVQSTGDWSTFTTLQLPPMQLQRTNARFALRATRLRGYGSLMNLKEIKLTPAKPAAPATDPTVAAVDEFAKLHADHITHMKSIATPLVDIYLAALKTIEADSTAKNDADSIAAIQAEAARTKLWLENPMSEDGTKRITSDLSTEGLEVLADAHFVPDAASAGDRFRINQGGKEYLIRLAWVSCPAPTPDDKTSKKFHAGYFGITEEDAVSVGKQAAEFTNSYLSDKPLRILTRWQKDQDGALYAIVVPDDIGDLASILVDNGLAAVNQPSAKNPPLRKIEERALTSLKEREAAAKQRPIQPGAWALAPESSPK